jgi:hypothetical protein
LESSACEAEATQEPHQPFRCGAFLLFPFCLNQRLKSLGGGSMRVIACADFLDDIAFEPLRMYI